MISLHTHTLIRHVVESLQSSIPPSVHRISEYIAGTFKCIDEASQESPAWTAWLNYIDSIILNGLKQMVLNAISSLVQRANQYEQGGHIPALVTVVLELQASEVQFHPPLSTHCASMSVPEAVHKWIEEYLSLANLVPMFETSCVGSTCYKSLTNDPELKRAVTKIIAHLETNARQCQVNIL